MSIFAILKDQLEAEGHHSRIQGPEKGQYKIISFFAKKARGTMSISSFENRLKPEDLKGFDGMGYRHDKAHSTPDQWVFLRDQAA